MSCRFFSALTSVERDSKSDIILAGVLTFIAGASNAGGFLAVKIYTSHMSGIVASMADFLVEGRTKVAIVSLGALLSFILGAMCTALMVNFLKRQRMKSVYAMPLALEALLLLIFGLMGSVLDHRYFISISLTVMLLCFLMGLQNALITKISNSRIRTTHVTGMVTDVGIELGKLIYWNRTNPHDSSLETKPVKANKSHLLLHAGLVTLFLMGGVIGALGFKYLGFLFTVPLAAVLAMLSAIPLVADIKGLLNK